ncbi:MAG: hypothetical protein ABIJ39_08435 [Chloroflexota bacterium]
MSEQSVSDLIGQLTRLFDERAALVHKRNGILDRQGRPIKGREPEEKELRGKINNFLAQFRATLAEWLSNEQKARLENPPLPVGTTAEIGFDVVLAAFTLGRRKQARAGVPTGQVYVLSHGFETVDQNGFPEIYLAGEVVEKNLKRKDVDAWVAALNEDSGNIRFTARQHLAGVSLHEEDLAQASFIIPARLRDPIQTLRRSGNKWMIMDGRKAINLMLKEQIEHRISEILLDRIQLWSAEKRDVLTRVCAFLVQDLKEWGLVLNTEAVSLVRQYPQNLYDVVFEFAAAEQTILDIIAEGKSDQLAEKTGLSSEQLTAIQVSARQTYSGGDGLFLVIRDLDSNKRSRIVGWLKELSKASAAGFVEELYSGKHSEQEVKLSEQVLLHAFKNPILGLGEGLDTDLDRPSHYRLLQEDFNLTLKEKAI